ncbi:hypothetical protein [Stenotrophomonas sp.]|uniref:InvB/SpaK family type III secretion system chaperone n=1 Tax=Stenotrophomonas sp. TaxID=69392 RepID=UPI002FC9EC24
MTVLLDTLTTALQSLGCDTQRFAFDTHSPVVMDFVDIGELLLEPEGDQLALWGRLETSVGHHFHGRADAMLEVLSEPADYLANGSLCLRQLGDACAVGGVLHGDCLAQPARLAQAIEQLHARIGQLQGLLR